MGRNDYGEFIFWCSQILLFSMPHAGYSDYKIIHCKECNDQLSGNHD